MSGHSLDERMSTVDAFMRERQWYKTECGRCGNTYYRKSAESVQGFCGRGTCGDGRAFLQLSKRKRPISPLQTYRHLANYFAGAGFEIVPSMNVASACGKTDLVIAGVQVFDGLIHHGKEVGPGQIFIGQPSIRMQFQDKVADEDGISTSFVNVCTEKMHQTFGDHLHTVDRWLGVFSSLGLHMKDLTIVVRTGEKDWGTGTFVAIELFLIYAGLELGDAAYMHVPTQYGSPVPISDIGFGLERIVWAANKVSQYYDLLMPGAVAVQRGACDAFRTMTLLALCGVQPGNKGAGLQFRRLAKTVSDRYGGTDPSALIAYYTDYWAHFASVASAGSIGQVICLELDRFLNLKICKAKNLPPPRKETTEEYFQRLVYTMGMDAQELRRLIQLCRN